MSSLRRFWLILFAYGLVPPATAAAESDVPKPAPVGAQLSPTPADRLSSIARSDKLVWTGVVIGPDRRVFVVASRVAGSVGPALAVLDAQGSPVAYPSEAWVWSGEANADPARAFIGLSAICLASDNSLWVVDSGVPGFGRAPLPGAAKLVRIDLAGNVVTRSYGLPPDVLKPKSLITQVRFNNSHAYLTDAGAPGLIVLDLASGGARRVLDGDPSTTGQRPITVDGETLKGPDNKPMMIDADMLEVTPDGRYLYYQPLPGPLFRVPTALLDDVKASPRSVAAAVQFWYDTPAVGGSAIGPDGTLYLSDIENDSLLALTPGRVLTTIIGDARLHWVASPFLANGVLTLPVAQLDRAAPFHHGKSQIRFPVELFSLRLSASPAPGTRR